MSEEKNETVSDIMTEMRTYADSMEKHLLYDLRECATDYLRVLADRIEAAANHQFRDTTKMISEEVAVSKMETTAPTCSKSSQVGNAAAMREALEKADEKRICDAVIQSLRDKKLEMAGEIAEKEAEIAKLRECLKEAIREKCPFTRMSCKHGETCDYECGTFKWRKALGEEGGAK